MKKTMKISIALLISFLFISISGYSQSDREWWDNLSPAWKQVFQKQELKGKDIDPNDQQLERLVNITHLDCSGNQDIKSLKPLSRLQYLEELRCEGTNVESLEGVENIKTLKVIDCSDNDNIDDLTPLMMVETLVELDCSNTMVKNLDPLGGLENLRILDLHFCTVNKILQLKELRRLELLDVSENPLYDIIGIKKMQGLIELNLSQTKVRDLSELNYLNNLQILNISKTSVPSLRALQDVKTLTELDCSDLNITVNSLDYLHSHTKLKMLRARNIDASQEEIDKFTKIFKKNIPGCTVIISPK